MPIVCSICQDVIDLANSANFRVTVCGHLFHFDCLCNWKRSSPTCPTCRTSIDFSKMLSMYPTMLNLSMSELVSSANVTLKDALTELQKQNTDNGLREFQLRNLLDNFNKLESSDNELQQLKKVKETLEKNEDSLYKRLIEKSSVETELNNRISLQKEELETYKKEIESVKKELQRMKDEMKSQEAAKRSLITELLDSKSSEQMLAKKNSCNLDKIESLRKEIELLKKETQELKTLNEDKKEKQGSTTEQMSGNEKVNKEFKTTSSSTFTPFKFTLPYPNVSGNGGLQDGTAGTLSNFPVFKFNTPLVSKPTNLACKNRVQCPVVFSPNFTIFKDNTSNLLNLKTPQFTSSVDPKDKFNESSSNSTNLTNNTPNLFNINTLKPPQFTSNVDPLDKLNKSSSNSTNLTDNTPNLLNTNTLKLPQFTSNVDPLDKLNKSSFNSTNLTDNTPNLLNTNTLKLPQFTSIVDPQDKLNKSSSNSTKLTDNTPNFTSKVDPQNKGDRSSNSTNFINNTPNIFNPFASAQFATKVDLRDKVNGSSSNLTISKDNTPNFTLKPPEFTSKLDFQDKAEESSSNSSIFKKPIHNLFINLPPQFIPLPNDNVDDDSTFTVPSFKTSMFTKDTPNLSKDTHQYKIEEASSNSADLINDSSSNNTTPGLAQITNKLIPQQQVDVPSPTTTNTSIITNNTSISLTTSQDKEDAPSSNTSIVTNNASNTLTTSEPSQIDDKVGLQDKEDTPSLPSSNSVDYNDSAPTLSTTQSRDASKVGPDHFSESSKDESYADHDLEPQKH